MPRAPFAIAAGSFTWQVRHSTPGACRRAEGGGRVALHREDRRPERALVVTRSAVGRDTIDDRLTRMSIAVTGVASVVSRPLAAGLDRVVALRAFHRRVRASQREAGDAVIERTGREIAKRGRLVARGACRAESVLVRIAVTGAALGVGERLVERDRATHVVAGKGEAGGRVALRALHLGVLAGQHEGGGGVVEGGRWLPCVVPVAASAVGAERASVGVLVARGAGRFEADPALGGVLTFRELHEVDGLTLGLVTVAAGGLGMLAGQRPAGLRMVELLERAAVPGDQIEIPSRVVGMAVRARCVSVTRVRSSLLFPQPLDVLVTGETVAVHVLRVARVAGAAVERTFERVIRRESFTGRDLRGRGARQQQCAHQQNRPQPS